MGVIKDMVGGFETLSKIGRCASNSTKNIMLFTLGHGEDPNVAIPPVFYPSCVLRRVDMANFLNYDKGRGEYCIPLLKMIFECKAWALW